MSAVHFLFRPRQRGGHVHVGVWAGTPSQARQQARAKLGDLIMDVGQWEAFRVALDVEGGDPSDEVDVVGWERGQ